MARRTAHVTTMAASETLIAAGVKIRGNLKSDGDIAIDGALQGDLKATGNITIGVNAVVHGNVSGINVTLGGQVFGNITAEGETIITEAGRLEGDLKTNTLGISAGAVFVGTCRTALPETTVAPESLTPPHAS